MVYQPIDYKISTTTVLNPDVLVVCKPIKGQYLEFAPELVVEILSPSTALKDRNTKYDLYQAEGVKYYLLIDPVEKQTEIYKLDGQTYLLTNEAFFEFTVGCSIKIDVSKFF